MSIKINMSTKLFTELRECIDKMEHSINAIAYNNYVNTFCVFGKVHIMSQSPHYIAQSEGKPDYLSLVCKPEMNIR